MRQALHHHWHLHPMQDLRPMLSMLLEGAFLLIGAIIGIYLYASIQ